MNSCAMRKVTFYTRVKAPHKRSCMKIHLFPIPRKAKFKDKIFNCYSKNLIVLDGDLSPVFTKHIETFSEKNATLFAKPLRISTGVSREENILLKIIFDPAKKISSQGYSLSASEKGLEIVAGDECGAFYALVTLQQILEQSGSHVPEFSISDFPDFKHRGIMLDISRCKVPSMDSLKSYIDLLVSFKFNQLQLYIEHTFAFKNHETVWFGSSPVTAEEIVELDQYCSDRYIDLVPNLNSFGHLERWLKHPDYKHLAECPDGFDYPWGGSTDVGGVLYPCKASLDFIDSLYKEFLPNFSSTLFNIGCDETWELGIGKSRKKTEKYGTEKIYLDFLLKLAGLVKKYNHKVMFWGDIILKKPELIKELPHDITALNWGYGADHPYNKECAKFANAGLPFYVCPGTSSWNAIIGVWKQARKNLANAAENGIKHGAEGYLITDWGDGGHHQYLPISYPGILAGACFSWCFKTNKTHDTPLGLDLFVFRDRAKVLGKLLLDISDVQSHIPLKLGNGSVFGRMLFMSDKELKETFKDIPEKSFNDAINSFDKLKKRIANARSQAYDGKLIIDEIHAGLEMAKFAAIRAKFLLYNNNSDELNLKHRLNHIIRIHEELWLKRNRYGGLRESSESLRSILGIDSKAI